MRVSPAAACGDNAGMKTLTPRQHAKATVRRRRSAAPRPVRIVIEGQLEIPPIRNLAEFREWACSDDFPETGRIDYIDGRIEVDTVTEEALAHGSPKSELARVILNRVRTLRLGQAYLDAMRVSCLATDLSVEPDIVVVAHESISSGKVRMMPVKSGAPRRYIELEGPPDLVVEVLSDSSMAKDSLRLFQKYYEAGVLEYWLVDARGDDLLYQVYRRGKSGYVRTSRDRQGFQKSLVLHARYRFEREDDRNDTWFYTLHERT